MTTPPAIPPAGSEPPLPPSTSSSVPATQPHARPEAPITEPNALPPPSGAPATQPSARPVVPPPPPSVFAPTEPNPLPPIPATPAARTIFATPAPPPPARRAAPPPPIEISGHVGGDVIGGDRTETTTAGRDVVGRDVVTTTTTNVGFSAAAVQRLLLTVGMMVFVTAACFFSGGVVLGGAAIAALDRDVASDDPALAAQFADLLATLQALPPGEAVTVSFSEAQISAYFRQVVAPTLPLNFTDGRVRLVDDQQLVVAGRAGDLANANVAATFDWQTAPGAPLRLTGAAIQALPLDDGNLFGWVAVPTPVLEPLTAGINDLFGGVRLTTVTEQAPDPVQGPTWDVTAIGQ